MKSKKASSRVTSANQETAAAAGAARRSTKRALVQWRAGATLCCRPSRNPYGFG